MPLPKLRLLDRLVLRPTRDRIDPGDQISVTLTVTGTPLRCFVHGDPASRPRLLVLKFPGTAGRAERSSPFPATILPDVESAVWTWNPPGYGDSAGRAGLALMAIAAESFFDQVVARAASDSTRIWLCGNSLGGCIAAHLAATRSSRVHGVVLRNAPPLADVVTRVARRYLSAWWVRWVVDHQLPEAMDLHRQASRIEAPTVWLQSDGDTLVPPAMQNSVIDVIRGPVRKVVLHGIDHDGIADDADLAHVERAIGWLWERGG